MSTNLLERLNDQRLRAVEAGREIAERAAAGEHLSATDESAYNRANDEIDRLGRLIATEKRRIDDENENVAAYGAAMSKNGRRGSSPEGSPVGVAIRSAFARVQEGSNLAEGLTLSLPEQRSAALLKAAGAATRGPETVPVTLVENLYSKMFDDAGVLLAQPSIMRTESGEMLKLPRVTALAVKPDASPFTSTDAKVAEGNAANEGAPTFDQVQLDSYKYAQYTQLSRELAEDSVLAMESVLGSILGRQIGNYLGYDLLLGTGTLQPRGVRTLVPTANKVDSAAGGLLDTGNVDKLIDVTFKLKPGYRRNAKWLVNDTVMATLRKLKMGATPGEYAYQPSIAAGMPDMLLGYPVVTDAYMPAPASGAGVTLIFGDFSMYFVRFVRDVRIEWSSEYAWINDVLTVKAVVRADGDAIDDTAFAAFNSIT